MYYKHYIKWTIMKVTNEEKWKIAYAKLVKRFLYFTGCTSVIFRT